MRTAEKRCHRRRRRLGGASPLPAGAEGAAGSAGAEAAGTRDAVRSGLAADGSVSAFHHIARTMSRTRTKTMALRFAWRTPISTPPKPSNRRTVVEEDVVEEDEGRTSVLVVSVISS